MPDPGAGFPAGDLPRPFIPGEVDAVHEDEEAAARPAPPFLPGHASSEYTPQPDMITDQVAELGAHASLPPITEFLYDEPVTDEFTSFAAERSTPQQSTPPRAQVPPLPGFTPAPGTPATSFAPQQPTPASAAAAYAATPTPAAPAPAVRTPTPAGPLPELRPTPPSPVAESPSVTPPVARPGGDWATGDWQRYDWSAASALGPEERARAAEAWSDLDWESDTSARVRQRNEAVAKALEGIAQRVRTGELLVHGHPGMSEEAAAAAALAALLARRS